MNTILIGESRTRVSIGDRFQVRNGSSCYTSHCTVDRITPDRIHYSVSFPYSDEPGTITHANAAPSQFASWYIWDYFAERLSN